MVSPSLFMIIIYRYAFRCNRRFLYNESYLRHQLFSITKRTIKDRAMRKMITAAATRIAPYPVKSYLF